MQIFLETATLILLGLTFSCIQKTGGQFSNNNPEHPEEEEEDDPSNDSQGQCLNPWIPVLYSVPEIERATSTHSINLRAQLLVQNFKTWCSSVYCKKYRTIDGSCNNARNLGMSFTPMDRLLPPEYDDDESTPRAKGKDGSPLASARDVSVHVFPALSNRPTQLFTHMLMQWGQWLDHDLSAIPVATEFDSSIDCCGPNGTSPPFTRHKDCFPIELSPDEPHFPGTCMEFVRSIPARDSYGISLYPREQVNSLTAFIDGSQIYGSTLERSNKLRHPENDYLLRMKDRLYLPESDEDDCIKESPTDYCFFAGDIRVNEQPGLGCMHTIFVRFHNYIAIELRRHRPYDTNEEIFQLTRKIVGAIQQAITYNEWLPLILGKTAMKRQSLTSWRGRSHYNPGVNPRIFNSFASAAFRFGHSLIPSEYHMGNKTVKLRLLFNRPREVLEQMDDLIAGMAGAHQTEKSIGEMMDRNFAPDVTQFLFMPHGGPHNGGLDLVALNIQRGRDHGIPPYHKFRLLCGLRPLTGFNDTEALGPFVHELAFVYKSIHDIDLFVGLIHEPVIGDGIVGPTLKCLLGTQFFRVKFGDKFFFDSMNKRCGFTDEQLKSIRRTTLASIICRNSEIPSLPKNVFVLNDPNTNTNPLIPCKQLKRRGLRLKLWEN